MERKSILNEYLPVTRRGLLKSFSAVAATAALAGCSSTDDDVTDDTSGVLGNPDTAPDLRAVRKVYSTCPVECLTHSLNCQLVGDQVIRVEPTQKANDLYFTTACGRGMSRMQFLTENRAATPMKRIKKGAAVSPLGVVLKDNSIDQWQSISWDQALREIADKLIPLKEDKGVSVFTGSGNMGPIANTVTGGFFAYAAPNRMATVGNSCCQSVTDGMDATYGERGVDTRDTIRDSKCIVCWGNNPADTTNTYWKFVADAKTAGAKLIVIDPRFSKSAERADQWIKLFPGTDALFAIGMLRYMFEQDITGTGSNQWLDESFLKHRTNAAYLIDLSSLKDDGSDTVIDFTDRSNRAWNRIQNLIYYSLNAGKASVYDTKTGAIVDAETNKGRGAPGRADPGTITEPDLYYYEKSADRHVATAYQLMRALYAGDLLQTAAKPIQADLYGLWDPNYNYTYIVNVTGIDDLDVLKQCATSYCNSGKKSMIIQNMGGGQRIENGASVCALHSILSLVTANVGDPGNGVDDTSGYSSLTGQTSDASVKKLGTAMTYRNGVAAPAGSTYPIPFGVVGQRMMDANNGTPQNIFMPSSAYPAGTKDPQMKFLWIASRNLLTQFPNTDALKESLRSTETVVVAKPTWNTDCDYADYVLPVTTPFEYDDIGAANRNKYVALMEGGVKPYGQARSDMQIMRELAKLVLPADQAAVFDHDDVWYVKDLIENPSNNFAANGIDSFEKLKAEKVIRPASIPLPWVPYRYHEFLGSLAIDNKAKIFITEWQYASGTPGDRLKASARSYAYPRISPNPAKVLFRGPFPRYVPALESQLPTLDGFPLDPDNPAQAKFINIRNTYKLNCVQFKTARSVHASFTGLSWIREAFGETGIVLINTEDAHQLGISNGETVTVKSSVGAIQRVARVTDGIMKGVTAVENSWWDKYGPVSSSTICAELPDPMGCGHTHNNTLVVILKGGMK